MFGLRTVWASQGVAGEIEGFENEQECIYAFHYFGHAKYGDNEFVARCESVYCVQIAYH